MTMRVILGTLSLFLLCCREIGYDTITLLRQVDRRPVPSHVDLIVEPMLQPKRHGNPPHSQAS